MECSFEDEITLGSFNINNNMVTEVRGGEAQIFSS